MWFEIKPVREKLIGLGSALSEAFQLTVGVRTFACLGRDVPVVLPSQLPDKISLVSPEGQARLLHDLANIELQAMELAVRMLFEFPEAPDEFKKELSDIAVAEGRHLQLCLDGIERLGFSWGHWPVHNSLWAAVGPEDSLIDRIMIVHRYLEGSGLDAGDMLLKRLSSVPDRGARAIMKTIATEEIDHVQFGSRWFKQICETKKLNAEQEFILRLPKIYALVPRRERVHREARRLAGFTEKEIAAIESIRQVPPAMQERRKLLLA